MKPVDEKPATDLTLSGEINLHRVTKAAKDGAAFAERRRKSRISEPFFSRVWGTDETGKAFELDCVLDNVSSQGVYLRLPRAVSTGEQMNLVVTFANGVDSGAKALLRCAILRTETQSDGRHGIALAITKYDFL